MTSLEGWDSAIELRPRRERSVAAATVEGGTHAQAVPALPAPRAPVQTLADTRLGRALPSLCRAAHTGAAPLPAIPGRGDVRGAISVPVRMAIGIGLDVGGTKILACALDEHGTLLAERRVATPSSPDPLFDAIAGCISSLHDDLGASREDVAAVGVGVPGLVDREGILHETANLYGMSELDLPEGLRARLERLRAPEGGKAAWRLLVDNDANCAAVAEHAFGAGRGVTDMVLVTLGTGIGGGIVSAGHLLRGARNFAGEVGHIVVDPRGPLCGCGASRCWERFCSGTGLAWLGQRAARAGRAPRLIELAGSPEEVGGHHVVEAASAGDTGARGVIEEYGEYLAIGLGNLAEALDPGRIVIGGGLITAGEALFGPGLARFASTHRRGSGPRAVSVLFASLGEHAGAFGAAALALGTAG